MILSSSSLSTHSTLTQAFLTFKTLFNTSLPRWLLIFLLLTLLRLNSCSSNSKSNLPKYTTSVNTSHSARNLGFIFDEHLTFPDQITALSKACYYHIRQLRCIRPYLDSSTACTRVARGSKFQDPTRPTKIVTRPANIPGFLDPTRPDDYSWWAKKALLLHDAHCPALIPRWPAAHDYPGLSGRLTQSPLYRVGQKSDTSRTM